MAWEGAGPGPSSRSLWVSLCLFRRPGLLPTWPGACSPLAPPTASVEGCFSRDLLGKWHLDSGLEASWGRTPHPTPRLRAACFLWTPRPGQSPARPLLSPLSSGLAGAPASWSVLRVGKARVKDLTPTLSVSVFVIKRAWGAAQAGPGDHIWGPDSGPGRASALGWGGPGQLGLSMVARGLQLSGPEAGGVPARYLIPPLSPLLLPQTPACNHNHTSHSWSPHTNSAPSGSGGGGGKAFPETGL